MASLQLKINVYGDLAQAITQEAGYQTQQSGRTVSAAKVVAAALHQLWGSDLSRMPHKLDGAIDRGSGRVNGAMAGGSVGSAPLLPEFDDLISHSP